jgi:myo-inositol-1(or 4)-monophosphatase
MPIAYYSEDRGLVKLVEQPEIMLVVDPIDGSRPAAAGFESCCFSAAAVPYDSPRTYGDITHAVVGELMSGDLYYASASELETAPHRPVRPSPTTDLAEMLWSIELTAHPIDELVRVYGHLIDGSVRSGGVFVFTSSSFSLTRLVTGQLDAHVDVGHRLLMDDPSLHGRFAAVGGGAISCLFPYDIAAAAFIAEAAGCRVTDAYGESLARLGLVTDKSKANQCSVVAAANPALHRALFDSLRFPRKPIQ